MESQLQNLERVLRNPSLPAATAAQLRACVADARALHAQATQVKDRDRSPATLHASSPERAAQAAATPRNGAGHPRPTKLPAATGGAGGGNASGSAVDTRPAHAVASALYLLIESLVMRLEADRASLYLLNERSGELMLAVNAGVGMPKPSRNGHPPLSTGLVSTCCSTGVAVNLPGLTLEDAADCPGPTTARNAIVFPVRRHESAPLPCLGAIVLINRHRGVDGPFGADDEAILAQMSPCIAYLARQYPIDHGAFAFNFAALHRVRPLELYSPPAVGLPASWSVQTAQLVYHRDGPEKYIRRENASGTGGSGGGSSSEADSPTAAGDAEDSSSQALESVAQQIRTVSEYADTVRACWLATVDQQMDVEKQIRKKQALITDAQEILHRKQDKLRHIKDALCDELEERALRKEGGPNGNTGLDGFPL